MLIIDCRLFRIVSLFFVYFEIVYYLRYPIRSSIGVISRTLIRAKILQVVYACHQKGHLDFKTAENELDLSLQTSHQLYHHLLLLIVALTEEEKRRLEHLKDKYFPSQEEKNPNRKLADNCVSEQLCANLELTSFRRQYLGLWDKNEENIVQSLLHEIKESDSYADYLASASTRKNEYVFWEKTFHKIILKNPLISELVEEKNVYWNDDLEMITIFVLKTLQSKDLSKQSLLPIFKEKADKKYALQLLYFSLSEKKEHTDLINLQMRNWDAKHIALLDLLIMQVALSEIKHFPEIPLKVTLNEYIDLARYYSTPQSPAFINGILQAVVSQLSVTKKEKV